jgi:hypothetical protein
MKKCSKMFTGNHNSFVLSDKVAKSAKKQMTINVLLAVVLGLQIYNLFGALGLFDTVRF